MLTRKTAIEEEYLKEALNNLHINQDSCGLYVVVPSEKVAGATHIVRCDETSVSVTAKSCSCVGNGEYGHFCKHMIVVQKFYDRIYKHDTLSNKIEYHVHKEGPRLKRGPKLIKGQKEQIEFFSNLPSRKTS